MHFKCLPVLAEKQQPIPAESCRYVSSLQIVFCKRCGCFWQSTPIVNLHNGTVCFSEAIKQASSNKLNRLQLHPVSAFSGFTFAVARNTERSPCSSKSVGKLFRYGETFKSTRTGNVNKNKEKLRHNSGLDPAKAKPIPSFSACWVIMKDTNLRKDRVLFNSQSDHVLGRTKWDPATVLPNLFFPTVTQALVCTEC